MNRILVIVFCVFLIAVFSLGCSPIKAANESTADNDDESNRNEEISAADVYETVLYSAINAMPDEIARNVYEITDEELSEIVDHYSQYEGANIQDIRTTRIGKKDGVEFFFVLSVLGRPEDSFEVFYEFIGLHDQQLVLSRYWTQSQNEYLMEQIVSQNMTFLMEENLRIFELNNSNFRKWVETEMINQQLQKDMQDMQQQLQHQLQELQQQQEQDMQNMQQQQQEQNMQNMQQQLQDMQQQQQQQMEQQMQDMQQQLQQMMP